MGQGADIKKLVIEAFGAYCLMYMRLSGETMAISIGGVTVGFTSLVESSLKIALLIWFGQAISGAIYFSAITIMNMINKTLDNKEGLFYLFAQLIGCFIAAF